MSNGAGQEIYLFKDSLTLSDKVLVTKRWQPKWAVDSFNQSIASKDIQTYNNATKLVTRTL